MPEEEEEGMTTGEMQCVNEKASKVARIALKRQGFKATGYCYRHFKAHLRNAGFPTADLEAKGYGGSAYKFAVWADKYPDALSKMGLKKVKLGLDELPKGALIIWPRGMCGYNKVHGHSEIVVDDNSSRACSEYCGRIKKGCGQPTIFVPKGCESSTPSEEDGETDSTEKTDDTTSSDEDTTAEDSDAKESGSCWSPTLERQVDELACVQARSNKVWFQCKDTVWYRGVKGDDGPYGACKSTIGL